MQADKFKVTGSWQQQKEDGHVYEAVAKTTDKAKRTIAVARGQMSLDVAHALDHYIGAAGVKAIEQSVDDTCKQMALASPE
jgi:hypothetical protein